MAREEWEYLEVSAVRREAPQGVVRDSFGGSRRAKADYVASYGQREIVGLVAVLNRVGDHGWELVNVLPRTADAGAVIAGSEGVVPTTPPVVLTLLLRRRKG